MSSQPLPWQAVLVIGNVVTVEVTAEDLSNFPKFMKCIVKEKVGLEQGFFKIRFVDEVEKSSLESICQYVQSYIEQRMPSTAADWPTVADEFPLRRQEFRYASVTDDLYGFQQRHCTHNDLKEVAIFSDQRSFSTDLSTCCSEALAESLDKLELHHWDIVRSNSTKSSFVGKATSKSQIQSLLDEGTKNREKYHVEHENSVEVEQVHYVHRKPVHHKETILYCPGIPVDNAFKCNKNFSLSTLGTILDLQPDSIPGVTSPYLYIGKKHACFPWHIEDEALFSINVVHYGAPCVWSFVAPSQYKMFVEVCHLLPLDPGHVSCTLTLLHKFLMASRVFLARFGINVQMVIQEEGEIIVSYPFAAHSGYKVGYNIQESVNFADPMWVEPALMLPSCDCLETSFKIDLKKMVAVARPNLLGLYLRKDLFQLVKALAGNDFLKSLGLLPPLSGVECEFNGLSQGIAEGVEEEKPSQPKFKGSRYTLLCPQAGCPKTVEGGRSKMDRMIHHINRKHSDSYDLVNKFKNANPPRGDLKSRFLVCPVCRLKRAGNMSHLHKHITKMHPDYAGK